MRRSAICVLVLLFASSLAFAQRRGGGSESSLLLGTLDNDRNGTLSKDEINAAVGRLKKLDRNGDGELSANELRRPMLPRGFGLASGSELDKPPLPKDTAEEKILRVLDEMTKGRWYANVSPNDGRVLRQLTEAVGATRVVELGTSSGYSAIWFALALRKTGGRLYTHEIDPDRAKMAQDNFAKAGVSAVVTVIEGDAHETVKQHQEPIDILFLDADKEGYVDYLDKLLPLIRPGGLILAHNMRVPVPDLELHRGHHNEPCPRNHLCPHARRGNRRDNEETVAIPSDPPSPRTWFGWTNHRHIASPGEGWAFLTEASAVFRFSDSWLSIRPRRTNSQEQSGF